MAFRLLTISAAIFATLFGIFSIAQAAQPALGAGQGGTGTSTWQTNSIPYFGGFRFTENNSGLKYDGSIFTTTNASTTNLSATVFCLIGDTCRTTWPTGGSGVWPFTPTTNYGVNVQSTSTPFWLNGAGVFASSTSARPAVAASSDSSGRAIEAVSNSTGPTLWMQQNGTNAFLITAIAKSENTNAIDIAHNPANPTLSTTKTFSLANNTNARGILALFTNNGTNKGLQVDNWDNTDYSARITSQGYGLYVSANGAGGALTPFKVGSGTATSTLLELTSSGNLALGDFSTISHRLEIGSTTGQNTARVNGLSTSGNAPCFSLFRSGTAEWTACGGGTAAADFNISANPNSTYTDASIASNAKLTLKTNGNVGIGTSSPTNKLEVAGNTFLGGNLTATGTLTFANVTGTTWADFCTSITGSAALCDGNDATGGGGAGAFATSSAETKGQIPYYTSTAGTPATLGSVATTSLAFSGPFSGASSLGALIGGANSTVLWTGLATTSQPASSNLLVSNGAAGVYGAATTTASCAGTASCTTFTVLGSSPVTITGSGSGAWPWTIGTNFGVAVNSTSTPTSYTNGVFASSTSQFVNTNIWGNLTLKATSSALLATDASGNVIATTSIGVNLLTGILPFSRGGTGAASFANTFIPYSDGTELTSSANLTYDPTIGPMGLLNCGGICELNVPLFNSSGIILNASTTAGTTFTLTPTQFCLLTTITFPSSNTTTVRVIFPDDASVSAACGNLTIGETGYAIFDNESNYPITLATTTNSNLTFRTTAGSSYSSQAYPVQLPPNSSTYGIPEQTSNNTAQIMLYPVINFGSSLASTTALTTTTFWMPGQATGCAQYDANGKLTSTGSLCGTGGGSISGWATTTPYASQLLLYPTNGTEDVMFGSKSSTTTAPFWWDVVSTSTYIGNGGTGTSSMSFAGSSGTTKWWNIGSYSSSQAGNGNFYIASSSSSDDITSHQFFTIDQTGLVTVTNASSSILSATTFCLTGDTCRTTWPTGGSGVWPFTPSTNFGVAVQSTSTPEWFTAGLHASSTSQFVNGNIWGTLNLKSLATAAGSFLAVDNLGNVIATSTPVSSGSGAWPWTTATNFGTSTNATTTVLWLQQGLYASSTSQFVNANFWGSLSLGSSTPFLTTGLTIGSTTPVLEEELNLATSTSMSLGIASGTIQHVDYSTSAVTITVSGFKVVPGMSTKVVTCGPNSGTGGAITWAAGSGVGLHYPGNVQPGNTTAASSCDEWFLDVDAGPLGSTTPWVIITQTPGMI